MKGIFWVGRIYRVNDVEYFGGDVLSCATQEEAEERAEVMREMGVTVVGIYHETREGIAEVKKF